MQYTSFGKSGLQVSKLCLGTMTFGLQCDERQSHAILDAAAAGGVDFLDAADVYPLGGGHNTAGRTEEIVGTWLRGKRHQYVLATKCVGAMGPKPWDQGMSRKHILDAIDASLRRLGTDYVDLYQLHSYDPATPIDEALEALDTVVRHGKARYVGVSNWPAYKVARAIGRSELRNLASIRSVQPRYNLLFRSFERDLLPLCAEEGVAVIPYNPLAGGLLTGKHDGEAPPPEGSRFQLGTAGRALPGSLLARAAIRDDQGAAGRRGGGGDEHGHHGHAVGPVPPGGHGAHHRRQPAGTIGRHAGRGGARAAAGRDEGQAGRPHGGVARGRRRPLIPMAEGGKPQGYAG